MTFWVYLLRCADGRFYTGHTDNLELRIAQHQQGGFYDFTSRRRPVDLVWQQDMQTRDDAFRAEFKVKNWSRAKKEALIAGDWALLSHFAKPPKERTTRPSTGVSTSLDKSGDWIEPAAHPRSSRAASRDVGPSSNAGQGVSTSLDTSGVMNEAAGRFATDLAALSPPGQLGLAVSGGPDSLALLLLADEALPGGFEVASVDHGLRPEGVAECAMVARLCDARGIPHRTLTVTVPATGNLQANARAARYAALAAWAGERGLSAIVTAHHADDQAETVLMRLNRGAGVRGLAGMRGCAAVPDHPELPLLRPLLGWRKTELSAVVSAAGLAAAHDPSNADPRFERAALRARLAQADWLDPAALAASTAHLAAADEALDWAARREWDERVARIGPALIYRPAAPRAVRLRVLERIVAELGHEGTPRGSELARLAERLDAGGTATLGGARCAAGPDGWRFTRAPARRPG